MSNDHGKKKAKPQQRQSAAIKDKQRQETKSIVLDCSSD